MPTLQETATGVSKLLEEFEDMKLTNSSLNSDLATFVDRVANLNLSSPLITCSQSDSSTPQDRNARAEVNEGLAALSDVLGGGKVRVPRVSSAGIMS